ncbi:adenylate/guanylate cyclase domain-containing protein [Actinocorallia longicatena]|uniref:Adenylate/guanylate cyclase domain-containing protein n=1 Tax=Actinocorallia longicatena TaxID=111803 RepID=A0ABP6QFD2_9ACTN
MNREHLDALSAKLTAIPGAPRSFLELRVRWFVASTVAIANASGAAVVLVFVFAVIPDPPGVPRSAMWVNLFAFLAYPVVAVPIAVLLVMRAWAPIRRLVREGGPPDLEQRHAVLLGPARITLIQAALWGVGAIGWTALNSHYGPLMALKMGMTCLLGAFTTLGLVYLLAERLLRPAAALVLATQPPREHPFSRVTTRSMLAWGLGTAVPLLGLIVVAIVAMTDIKFERHEVAQTVLVLGCTALVISFQVTFVAVRAIGDPIQSVRQGMTRVAKGDLDTSIVVYDASELGQLQAGFNSMVAGLRAHERLQDLFSRQVGPDVAKLALDSDIALGGELKDVAVLFVDLAGSTKMAAERPPDEVVALLNAFFGVVVDCVNRNGGWINKFEGDAALAVWGAPVPQEEAAGRALTAARELAARLPLEIPEVLAGVGVSCGPVVAGYIGAEQRFEYTVIGDPVNEAARLSDLAKSSPSRVLANSDLLEDCDPVESLHWESTQAVTLRGRPRPTLLASPRPTDAPLPPLLPPSARRRRRLGVLPLLRREPRNG